MQHIKCACGRVMYEDVRGNCPQCNRPLALAKSTNEEIPRSRTMRKSIIVAAAQNGVIGANGKLPWHLPGDLRRFKELTMGHTLIMGRKTYESLPPKVRPLPGRVTTVLSRNKQHYFEPTGHADLRWSTSIELALGWGLEGETEVFICGGGEVYREALPLVDRVYLTVVERDFEGDTEFDFPLGDSRRAVGDHTRDCHGDRWRFLLNERGEGELPHRFEIWDRVR